jgi:hypothetical protein
VVKLLLAALLLLSATTGGCTLFDEDPPPGSCSTDQDCFRAQGESCNQTKHVCEVQPDAGVDAQ